MRLTLCALVLLGASACSTGPYFQILKAEKESRRFVYLKEVSPTEKTYHLGEIRNTDAAQPIGVEIRQIASYEVDQMFIGHWVTNRVLSPTGRFLAIISYDETFAGVGGGFTEANVIVADLRDESRQIGFNEHKFSNLGRAQCPSIVFQTYLDAEAAAGVPASVLAMRDFHLGVEGEIAPISAASWANETNLLVTYRFSVILDGFPDEPAGTENFTIEYNVDTNTLVSCNANKPTMAAIPQPGFPIAALGTTYTLNGKPVAMTEEPLSNDLQPLVPVAAPATPPRQSKCPLPRERQTRFGSARQPLTGVQVVVGTIRRCSGEKW